MVSIITCFMLSALTALPAPRVDQETSDLERAIVWLGNFHRAPVKKARAHRLAKLFSAYGKRWKVDPWMAIAIACQESKFRDRPRRIYIKKCKTVLEDGKAIQLCTYKWPGERGVMQVVPRLVRASYHACTGWDLQDPSVLENTGINVCVGMHLMAYRRDKVRRKLRKGRRFNLRGGRIGGSTTRHHGPCSRKHVKFCLNGNLKLCNRWWWVASWNWGTHQVFCGNTSRRFDFSGYPIRVLRRYKRIISKFRSKRVKSGNT